MALFLDLPVYKVCNELYIEFVMARRMLQRTERYTIGQELDRAIVDVLVLIQRINSTREKVPLIVRARQLVMEIQVRTRVLRDIKALSIGAFTKLFDLSESISKQLASWQRFSQKQQLSDANASSSQGGRPESVGSRFGGARHTANPMNGRVAPVATDSAAKGDPTANTEVTS